MLQYVHFLAVFNNDNAAVRYFKDNRLICWHDFLRDELIRQDIWQSTVTQPTPYDARGQEQQRYSVAGFSLRQDYSQTGLLLAQTAGAETVNRCWHYDNAFNVRSTEDTRWGKSHYRYNRNYPIIHAEQRGIQPLLESAMTIT